MRVQPENDRVDKPKTDFQYDKIEGCDSWIERFSEQGGLVYNLHCDYTVTTLCRLLKRSVNPKSYESIMEKMANCDIVFNIMHALGISMV